MALAGITKIENFGGISPQTHPPPEVGGGQNDALLRQFRAAVTKRGSDTPRETVPVCPWKGAFPAGARNGQVPAAVSSNGCGYVSDHGPDSHSSPATRIRSGGVVASSVPVGSTIAPTVPAGTEAGV